MTEQDPPPAAWLVALILALALVATALMGALEPVP